MNDNSFFFQRLSVDTVSINMYIADVHIYVYIYIHIASDVFLEIVQRFLVFLCVQWRPFP